MNENIKKSHICKTSLDTVIEVDEKQNCFNNIQEENKPLTNNFNVKGLAEYAHIKDIKLVLYIVLPVLLLILLMIEPFLRDPLFNESIKSIKILHKSIPNKDDIIYRLSMVLSYAPKYSLVFSYGLIIYCYCNTSKTMFYIFALCGSNSLTSFLKLIYKNPRPVWTTNEIIDFSCHTSYGNPSGHSLESMAVYLSLWEIAVNSNKFFNNKKILKYILFIFTLLLILSIAISRVLIGVHSINQILFGLSLGVLFFFALKFLIFDGDLNSENKFKEIVGIDQNERSYSFFLLFSVFIILINISALGIYFLTFDKTLEDKWNLIIDKECKNYKPEYGRLSNNHLTRVLTTLSLIFMIGGILYEYNSNFLGDKNKFLMYNFDKENSWNSTNAIKGFFRCLVTGVTTVFIFYICSNIFIENKVSLAKEKALSNNLGLMIFLKGPFTFIMCMLYLFGFNKHFLKFLNLTNEKCRS